MQTVQIGQDGKTGGAEIDATSGYIVSLDAVHARIHEGVMYQATRVVADVANNGDMELLVQTAVGQPCHMRIEAGAGGDATLDLYEDTTISGAGTAVAARNRNRVSANTAQTTVTHTPTVTGDGTLLSSELQPGGSGFLTPGATRTGFEEWILKANSKYLIRLTNVSGAAQDLGLSLMFYEDGG